MYNYFVYIIKGSNGKKTKYYVGSTNDLHRRIRQHNRELIGGAKATSGFKWNYYMIIANIDSKIEALQIEWRLKHQRGNIHNKIINFISYIQTNHKPSPNCQYKLKNRLLIYNSSNNQCINSNSNHFIIVNIELSDNIGDGELIFMML